MKSFILLGAFGIYFTIEPSILKLKIQVLRYCETVDSHAVSLKIGMARAKWFKGYASTKLFYTLVITPP